MTFRQHGHGSSRTAAVVGIFSRVHKDSVTWLSNFLTQEFQDLVSEVRILSITNSREREVKQCSAGILYLSMRPDQSNFTDGERTTLTWDLQYLHSALGREKLLVVLDNMKQTDENERQRILNTEPTLRQQASQLILIPYTYKRHAASERRIEFREFLQTVVLTLQPDQTSSSQNRNPAVYSRYESPNMGDSGGNENTKKGWNIFPNILGRFTSSVDNPHQTKPEQPPQPRPQFRIRIFSRSGESHYTWIMDRLKAVEGMGSPDIRGVCLTNEYDKFTEEARECDFSILYHSLRHGRVNISNVTDALYDNELQDLSHNLGKSKVIVVADDLKKDDSEEKDRILQNQPSIERLARDLFLFTEFQKSPQNILEICQIIQSEFQATPHHGRTSSHNKGDPAAYPTQEQTKGTFRMDHSYQNKPNRPSAPQYRIRIFSRDAERSYLWLISRLKASEGMGSADIRAAITNQYRDLTQEATTCELAILYQTAKHRGLNNVTDSPYDEDLKDLSGLLGREKVIVVMDDLKRDDGAEKDRILQSQPSIARYARDLFLFREHSKNPQNVSEIDQLIKRDLQTLQASSDSLQAQAGPLTRSELASMQGGSAAVGINDPKPPESASSSYQKTSSCQQDNAEELRLKKEPLDMCEANKVSDDLKRNTAINEKIEEKIDHLQLTAQQIIDSQEEKQTRMESNIIKIVKQKLQEAMLVKDKQIEMMYEELKAQQLQEMEEKMKKQNKKVEAMEEERDTLKRELQEWEEAMENLKREIQEREEGINKDHCELQEKEKEMKKKKCELQKRKVEIREENWELQEMEEKMQSNNRELQKEEEEFKEKNRELQKREVRRQMKELQETEDTIKRQQEELQDREDTIRKKKNELKERMLQNKNQKWELQESEEEMKKQKRELQKKEWEMYKHKKKLKDREEEMKKKNRELQKMEDKVKKEHLELQQMDNEMKKLQKERETRMKKQSCELREREEELKKQEWKEEMMKQEREFQNREEEITKRERTFQEKEKKMKIWEKELEDREKDMNKEFQEMEDKKNKQDTIFQVHLEEILKREKTLLEKEEEIVMQKKVLQDRETKVTQELNEREDRIREKERQLHDWLEGIMSQKNK